MRQLNRTQGLQRALCGASIVGLTALAGCPREQPTLPDAYFELPDSNIPPDAGDAGRPERCTMPGATLGIACGSGAECDDGCFCNGVETCTGGTCRANTALPCAEDMHACTTVACNEAVDRCVVMTDDEMCSNGDACDGREICATGASGGCRPAPALVCNDESSCTIDSCDPATGCVYTQRDLDHDGFVAGSCGGDDCDDDPRYGTMIFPGASEVCDNRRDDDCDGTRDYNDSDCRPLNDTCDVATTLMLGPTGGTFSGGTAGLRSNYRLSCGGSMTAPDAVFRFTLTAPQDVQITATAAGATIALRPFAQCAAGPDEKCGTGNPPSVRRRSLPAGDYAIIVQTPSAGAFDVSVRLSPPTTVPLTDRCNPMTELLPAGRSTHDGVFEEVDDDYRLSCNASAARDVVYAFDVPAGETRDVTIDATVSGATFSDRAFLSLTTDCTASSGIQCRAGGASTQVRQRALGPGRYYVVLEASVPESNNWTLTANITPPVPPARGDACSTAAALSTTTPSVTLDVAAFENDGGVSCGSFFGDTRDAVYSFTLTEPHDVTLTASTSSFFTQVAAALQTSCGVAASEQRCAVDSPVRQFFRSLPAGTYYYVIETDQTGGTVTAAISIAPPTTVPPADVCPGVVMPASGFASGTTIDFESQVDLDCSGSNRADAFYRIDVPVMSRVTAVATRTTGNVAVGITPTCGSRSTLACGPEGATSSAAASLAPGTYYIVVETPTGDEGTYELDVVQRPL